MEFNLHFNRNISDGYTPETRQLEGPIKTTFIVFNKKKLNSSKLRLLLPAPPGFEMLRLALVCYYLFFFS